MSFMETDHSLNNATASARRDIPRDGQWRLAYHEISAEKADYLYTVGAARFQEHLAALNSGLSRSLPKITFDDGHLSIYTHAFALLEKFGVKATFFVIPEFIGRNSRCVSWDQLREMIAEGHDVQSHGLTHRLLTQSNRREIEVEHEKSKREIEDRLGVEVAAISAPGGRYDKNVIAAAMQAGYAELYHSNPWTPDHALHGLCVKGRLMVTKDVDGAALCKHPETSAARKFYFRTRHAAKNQLRNLLGDTVYHKLWCALAHWKPDAGIEVSVNGDQADRTALET